MKPWVCTLLSVLVMVALAGPTPVSGQTGQAGTVIVPESSRERPEDIGRRAHTNHLILWHPEQGGGTPVGLDPDVIRAAYGLPAYTLGESAGSQVIAIVDAYHYPTALADFNAFAQTFGLPQETGDGSVLQVIYATGSRPKYNSGWSQEAALDIEWAHAMAPTAKIILVEAASSSWRDLLWGVDVASGIDGVCEVSMSWGGSEFAKETLDSYDGHFIITAGIVYFAASGDTGGKTIWPGVSPYVVCAGGTTLNINSSGDFLSEMGWSGSGGGKSKYEPRPSYQDGVEEDTGMLGPHRGAPDFSFDADPRTGVSVCWQGGWYIFGGTSVSTPSLAGIVNLAAASAGDDFAASSFDELSSRIYANLGKSSPSPDSGDDFRDIVTGSAGRYRCMPGWDFVTGAGSDWGLEDK